MWLGIWLASAAIAGATVGFFLGFRTAIMSMQPEVRELNRNLASDRSFALSLLRRELANWMFRRDPDRYLGIYRKVHETVAAIGATNRGDQLAKLAKLTEQYRFYRDFDLVSTRDYVLYGDALSAYGSYDEAALYYTDIIRFQALKIALDNNWSETYPPVHTTDGAELAHLETYVQRFKDTRLKHRMKDAIREFFDCRSNTDERDPSGETEPFLYKTAKFNIRRVSHFAETRYGIHFNDPEEFGLYTTFYGDRDAPYIGFYRSDARFQSEAVLNDIVIDEPV
jgi:hypothetical protein